MARRQVVTYTVTCDVCGEMIPDSDAEDNPRQISWDGADYQVDVCSRHRIELSDALDRVKAFVDAGATGAASRARRSEPAPAQPRRGPGGARPAPGPGPSRDEVAAIRAWGLLNGHEVGHRGRIPARLVAAYRETGASGDTPPVMTRRARRTPAE